MGYADAVRVINKVKAIGAIRDYVIIGTVASYAHMEPMHTDDLDIIVLVDSDPEFIKVYRALAEIGEIEQEYIRIAGVKVNVFPSTMTPLFANTYEGALEADVLGERTKVASREHLIVHAARVWRPKDQAKAGEMLPKADRRKLKRLLEQFDDAQGTLAKRLESLRRR